MPPSHFRNRTSIPFGQIDQLGRIAYACAMVAPRTLTSSEAKSTLGELLGSLAVDGPVSITRHGRPIALLTAATQRTASSHAALSTLAPLFAAGALPWSKVADETGASFGDLLLELAAQGLRLPQVTATKRLEQAALLDATFAAAAVSDASAAPAIAATQSGT